MAIMRVTPPPTTVRTGTRCPDEGASEALSKQIGLSLDVRPHNLR